jgi:hypothetical protein
MAKRKNKNKEMKNSSKKMEFRGKMASVFLAVWVAMVLGSVLIPVAWAANPGTVIPEINMVNEISEPSGVYCGNLLGKTRTELQKILNDPLSGMNEQKSNDILGCALKTGRFSLWMLPYYIKYIIEFILYIGGLVAVGGILFGGATYVFSGLSNDKEKGKKAILYSVIGMVLMYMAWAIVNIVIGLLTG